MSWYASACRNNAAFLGVAVALIVLCWVLSIVCRSQFGANLIPNDTVREHVKQTSFQSAVVVFLIAMLVMFACANGAASSAL
jgi:succinate dehydrogenase hydrophobic anchor subunit